MIRTMNRGSHAATPHHNRMDAFQEYLWIFLGRKAYRDGNRLVEKVDGSFVEVDIPENFQGAK